MNRFKTWQLFAICVVVWGTTWHAITYQLVEFPAEVGVALRFALAGASVLAFCRWRGVPLVYPLADHAALALQGVFLYGVSYVCVYQAERFVPSGLVAVGYSAAPLLAGIGAALLFGTALGRRFVVGGLLGLCGVALIFWPEITRSGGGDRAALGALLTVASVLLSAVGSLAASRNRRRGVALLPALGFGMLYGAAAAAIVALAFGRSVVWPTAPSWWLSLAYLAFAGSVLTFACFLTLQDRVGPGPAGTIGVMTPLLALVVSVAFEGFRPDVLTAAGAALAVAGNALMLIPARSGRPVASAPAREAG
ncbi:MAG TPA: EamA family transporter [Caldimonas sp.]|nr:EamA family transporter [Caldimonas sp.]HEV7575569.1 EamA family transporter [Caldimonas sp.]